MNKMALAMIWLAVLLAGCGGFVARRRQCRPKPGWRVLRCAEYRHRADQPLGGAASEERVEKVLQQRAWWHATRGRLGKLLSDQLVMADLGTAGFKVVGSLVIIMCDATKQRL